MAKIDALTAEDLEIPIDLSDLTKTDKNDSEWGIIGQPRAKEALEMGIHIQAKGYNLFVTGDSGTGRYTAVNDMIRRNSAKKAPLNDLAYVYNFAEEDKPRILYFTEGEASRFKKEMKTMVERFKSLISHNLQNDNFKKRRDKLIASAEYNENRMLSGFESDLNKDNFQTIQIEDEDESLSTDILPVFDGEPVDFDTLQSRVASGLINQETWNETREKYYHHIDRLKSVFAEIRNNREELDEKLEKLKMETVKDPVHRTISRLKEKWPEKDVCLYLDEVEKHALENLTSFINQELGEDEEEELSISPEFYYDVNIIVDNSRTETRPIINEINPTISNLFGAVETRLEMGAGAEVRTSYMMIRAGSLLKASGGFLLLRAEDLLTREGVWPELKKALQYQKVELEIQASPFSPPTTVIKPQKIRFNTKIIIIGPAHLYDLLTIQEDDFAKFFKISAEFNSVMPRNNETLGEYVNFIKAQAKREQLREPDEEGIREICRYGIKLAERKDFLSTRFSLISDLLRESDYRAAKNGSKEIGCNDVRQAIEARHRMLNMAEEEQHDQIRKGLIMLESSGSRVGAVNGLAVLERGTLSFGTTMRITATVGIGKEGIINIEREAGLSGDIHNKGILILEGFLRDRFARNYPLSISAGICIEQSYYEIEGDSASSTELYALLSAIADVPLRQDLAVTGSVNQFGEIQPVGGVSEKIEGFFNVCRIQGLTGTQGVIIPESNRRHVILPEKVKQAVRDKQFYIYPVSHIDQGMELLTGLPAGELLKNGRYPKESLNQIISQELKEMNHLAQ